MMAVARRTLNRWWVFWPALGLYLAMGALPARVWFDSHSIAISDAVQGSRASQSHCGAVLFACAGRQEARRLRDH